MLFRSFILSRPNPNSGLHIRLAPREKCRTAVSRKVSVDPISKCELLFWLFSAGGRAPAGVMVGLIREVGGMAVGLERPVAGRQTDSVLLKCRCMVGVVVGFGGLELSVCGATGAHLIVVVEQKVGKINERRAGVDTMNLIRSGGSNSVGDPWWMNRCAVWEKKCSNLGWPAVSLADTDSDSEFELVITN
jgi:hypothetical protein